jgi:hypothetical protein
MSALEQSIWGQDSPEGVAIIAQEPLLELIIAYRNGLADFAAHAPEDPSASYHYAEASYRAPRNALEAWVGPARTFSGAIAALRMARDADQNDDSEIVSVMVLAALGYFETVS